MRPPFFFRSPAALLALPALALVACAGERPNPPSLMPRAAEKSSLEEPNADTAPKLPALPAALTRANALVGQARDAVSASERVRPRVRVSAARGSDPWIEAQVAASAAEAAMIPARGALAECERLIVDAVASGRDATALEGSRDTITALVAAQQSRLDAVSPR